MDLIASQPNVQGRRREMYCITMGIPSVGHIIPDNKKFGKYAAMARMTASTSSVQKEEMRNPMETPPRPIRTPRETARGLDPRIGIPNRIVMILKLRTD